MLRLLTNNMKLKFVEIIELSCPICCCSYMRINSPSQFSTFSKQNLNSYFQQQIFNVGIIRTKYNKHFDKKGEANEESDSDIEEDEIQDKNIVKLNVNSLRTDLIIKAALGLARNKVELKFYEGKIRINGNKITKKSLHLNIGDEVDVIKGVSAANPDHLIVGRIELISAIPKNESVSIIVKRFKSLIVENYEGRNVWKPIET